MGGQGALLGMVILNHPMIEVGNFEQSELPGHCPRYRFDATCNVLKQPASGQS